MRIGDRFGAGTVAQVVAALTAGNTRDSSVSRMMSNMRR
jgi:hypothetical protein